MKKNLQFLGSFGLVFLLIFSLSQISFAAMVRVSGDNTWTVFINGEEVASGADWQVPTVSEFELDNGFGVVAVYVHDLEPGAAGVGGFLADIILDDGTYIGTSDYEGDEENTWPGWKTDGGIVLDDRDDGWEKVNFDDSEWSEPQEYEQFGGGVWGFGTAKMEQVLHDPDCLAYWIWHGPNDGVDDAYFRYTIGSFSLSSKGKLTTTWGKIKSNL